MGLLLLTTIVGCSEKVPYELAKVRGSVTLDGEKLTNTDKVKFKVMFSPIAKDGNTKAGKPGFSQLTDDSTYVLSSYGSEDGAVVGKHWVTLIRKHLPTGNTPDTYRGAKFERYRLPTPFVVEAGEENVIDLKVTSDDLGG